MTANDRLLDFMAQMPRVEPDDQFVAMSWVVIKLQPLQTPCAFAMPFDLLVLSRAKAVMEVRKLEGNDAARSDYADSASVPSL
jgi:hypothetical protein